MNAQRIPDMIYSVHKSKHSGGPSGRKRLSVTPLDAPDKYFHPDHWDRVCNIKVYYKPEFILKIAKEQGFNFVDFYYPSNEMA